jgi:hypothetical protein
LLRTVFSVQEGWFAVLANWLGSVGSRFVDTFNVKRILQSTADQLL